MPFFPNSFHLPTICSPGSDPAPWILAAGTWADSGRWRDAETWNDGD